MRWSDLIEVLRNVGIEARLAVREVLAGTLVREAARCVQQPFATSSCIEVLLGDLPDLILEHGQPPLELQQIGLGNSWLFVSCFLVMVCETKILSCSCSKSIKLQESGSDRMQVLLKFGPWRESWPESTRRF